MKRYLQQEWHFLQCNTPEAGPEFGQVEIYLQESFPMDLFQDAEEDILGVGRDTAAGQSGRTQTPWPNYLHPENWNGSMVFMWHLISIIQGGMEFI